jgi:hypothetical protein
MHFYWRIIEELRFMGERITFHDPNLMRCYELWLKKNADAISLISGKRLLVNGRLFGTKGIPFSPN